MPKNLKFKIKNSKSGFTLVEILIYMGLVGILIGSTVAVTYNLIEGQGRLNQSIINDSEAQFLIAKIDWALSGVSVVNSPAPNNSGPVLSVDKIGFSPPAIIIDLDNGQMRMDKGGGAIPLNSSWTEVTNLNFVYGRDAGTFTDSITATFDLNGKTYETRRLISR